MQRWRSLPTVLGVHRLLDRIAHFGMPLSPQCLLLHSRRQLMRVLGIDCGGEYTGYGVVEQDGEGSLHHLCSGAIRLLPREALELRLKKICDGLTEIISHVCARSRWPLKTFSTR